MGINQYHWVYSYRANHNTIMICILSFIIGLVIAETAVVPLVVLAVAESVLGITAERRSGEMDYQLMQKKIVENNVKYVGKKKRSQ